MKNAFKILESFNDWWYGKPVKKKSKKRGKK